MDAAVVAGMAKGKKQGAGDGNGDDAVVPDVSPSPRARRWLWAIPALAELTVVTALVIAHIRVGEIGMGARSVAFVADEASVGALPALQDASMRMWWGVSWAALLVAGLAAATVSILLLRESLRSGAGPRGVSGRELSAWVLLVLLVCVLLQRSGAFFGDEITGSLRPEHLRMMLEPLTTVTDVTTAAATVLIVAAVSAVLWRHGSLAAGKGAPPASRDRIKVLLYVGAALLMVGAIEVDYLFRWPAVWLEDATLREPLREYARATSTTVGLMGSLQLIAIFLPAFLLLREESERGAGTSAATVLPPKQLFARALESSRLVLAVLAPILGTWFEQQFA